MKTNIATLLALATITVTSANAQLIQYPTAFYGDAPLQSGYGGSGRAVSVAGLGNSIQVRSWLSPGVGPRHREGISTYPPVYLYEWYTFAGEVWIYPEDSPWTFPSFPLWLYGTGDTDAIRLQCLLPGTYVTVYGLPGAYSTESTILLPTGPACWGYIGVPAEYVDADAIRFSPVRVDL